MVFFGVTVQEGVSVDRFEYLRSNLPPGAEPVQAFSSSTAFGRLVQHSFATSATTATGANLATAWVLEGNKLFSVYSDEAATSTVEGLAEGIYFNIENHRA